MNRPMGFLQFMNECFEADANGKGVWVTCSLKPSRSGVTKIVVQT